ncbi:MAG: phosphodiester glycosidase family protein [Chitinophagaceae bacterium]
MRLLTLFLSFSILQSFAQTDSTNISRIPWTNKKIAKGIYLQQYWFEQSLFHSNEQVSILKIKLRGKNKIDVIAEQQELKTVSTFGNEQKNIAAINGTFFDTKNGGSVDYVRVDGQVINGNKMGKNNTRALHQKAALLINKKHVSIVKWDSTADWEQRLRGEDIMVTGPLLLQHGHYEKLDTGSMYEMRHPRSAIAIKGNFLWMITVDGRNQHSAGMTLYELASFLKWMGADEAINLDGGGSTTLWIQSEPDGIVNYPSDNKKMDPAVVPAPGVYTQKWDHTGERKVANVVVVR